jgi:hypothetical protein
MKKLLLFAGLGIATISAMSQPVARVQAIHNSADAAASTVDVWLTTPSGSILLLDDFSFRNASPFVDAPAGVPISLGIAPSTSNSVGDVISGLSFNYTLTANETYILVAEGIVSSTGYSPATPFDIEVYAMGQESSVIMGNTDVLVHHGVTDAPTVDIYEAAAGQLVNDASYTDFAGYLQLATADYDLQVRDNSGSTILKAYDAPLLTLNLTNEALVVLASGFLNPANNSNGPSFGLFVALAAGGPLVELPEKTARVQAIHNSADAATATVDVYMTTALGSSLLVDDFSFRNATTFIDAPAGGVEFSLSFAGGNSSGVNDTIAGLTSNYSLTENETYIIVADGIVSGTGYNPAPPFTLEVYAMGQESSAMVGNTDVLVHHGSTDAPAVDVYESSVPAGNIVTNASYTDFAGYLALATADYTLEVRPTGSSNAVATYDAPLATLNLQDEAIVVLASGFLDPSMNSNGPAFGLYVALASGGALVALPVSGSTGLDDNASRNLELKSYPNPTIDLLKVEGIDLNSVNTSIIDASGRIIKNGVFSLNGNTINVSRLAQGNYHVIISTESEIIGHLKFIKK